MYENMMFYFIRFNFHSEKQFQGTRLVSVRASTAVSISSNFLGAELETVCQFPPNFPWPFTVASLNSYHSF